jgi:hypothetical protein
MTMIQVTLVMTAIVCGSALCWATGRPATAALVAAGPIVLVAGGYALAIASFAAAHRGRAFR